MKLKIFMLAVFVTSVSLVSAQSIRFNPYGTGVFDDKVDSYYSPTSYYKGRINGGFQWGSGLEFRVNSDYGLELMYLRQDTKVPLEYFDYSTGKIEYTQFDVAFNYIMLGGVRSFHVSNRIEPYAGLMGGLAIVNAENPESGRSETGTRFAWGLRGGLNIWLTKIVGLKFQAQLMSISQAIGGGMYFGTGGVGAGVSSYSSMLQFGLGSGFTFKLGK
jgi:hypothetical protein